MAALGAWRTAATQYPSECNVPLPVNPETNEMVRFVSHLKQAFLRQLFLSQSLFLLRRYSDMVGKADILRKGIGCGPWAATVITVVIILVVSELLSANWGWGGLLYQSAWGVLTTLALV